MTKKQRAELVDQVLAEVERIGKFLGVTQTWHVRVAIDGKRRVQTK